MWNYKTPGIPDEHFDRAEKVPITKTHIIPKKYCFLLSFLAFIGLTEMPVANDPPVS